LKALKTKKKVVLVCRDDFFAAVVSARAALRIRQPAGQGERWLRYTFKADLTWRGRFAALPAKSLSKAEGARQEPS